MDLKEIDKIMKESKKARRIIHTFMSIIGILIILSFLTIILNEYKIFQNQAFILTIIIFIIFWSLFLFVMIAYFLYKPKNKI